MNKYHRTIKLKAFSFALLATGKAVYVAEAGNSFISREQIKGKLLEHILHKDYSKVEKSVVEVKIEPVEIPQLSEIIEITWPYSTSEIAPDIVWETLISNHPEKIIANEQGVLKNILGFLEENSFKFSDVVEYGSSHGELIKLLNIQYPRINILGIDPSKSMIDFSSKNAPSAKFIQGDFSYSLMKKYDLAISRALGNGVVAKEELSTILGNINRAVKLGGNLIFHSYSPPVISKEILEKHGEVLKTVSLGKDCISPFYVMRKYC